MADNFQSFLDWFSDNVEALSRIGAALVVVIGGLWQVYRYFDRKKASKSQRH